MTPADFVPVTFSNHGVETTIARAHAEEAAVLSALSIEVWLDTYAESGISTVFAEHALKTYSAAAIRDHILNDDAIYLLARRGQFVQGYLKLDLDADPVSATSGPAEIGTLYVRRHHQRQGIGRALAGQAAGIAATAGRERLFLTVFHENIQALSFYEALGFVRAGRHTFVLEGEPVPNIIMTLGLPKKVRRKAAEAGEISIG